MAPFNGCCQFSYVSSIWLLFICLLHDDLHCLRLAAVSGYTMLPFRCPDVDEQYREPNVVTKTLQTILHVRVPQKYIPKRCTANFTVGWGKKMHPFIFGITLSNYIIFP